MNPFLTVLMLFGLFANPPMHGQSAMTWKVRGDTIGARPGCAATAAIATIDRFFKVFPAGDSATLASALASRMTGRFVVTTGRFTPGDTWVRLESIPALMAYARSRALQHERYSLDSVRFTGWRGAELGFMPFYKRSADDLGATRLPGLAKAAYWCNLGIKVINLGPQRH